MTLTLSDGLAIVLVGLSQALGHWIPWHLVPALVDERRQLLRLHMDQCSADGIERATQLLSHLGIVKPRLLQSSQHLRHRLTLGGPHMPIDGSLAPFKSLLSLQQAV